jgi:uncharacterized Tic20 family protein
MDMTATPQQAPSLSRETRKWAMLCHLIALVGLLGNGVGFLLGPLVVWLLKKEDDPFIDEQGKEAVNFQITMFIAALICAPFVLVLIGILFLILIGLLMTILPIIGAIKANEGEHYRYPISFRFLK